MLQQSPAPQQVTDNLPSKTQMMINTCEPFGGERNGKIEAPTASFANLLVVDNNPVRHVAESAQVTFRLSTDSQREALQDSSKWQEQHHIEAQERLEMDFLEWVMQSNQEMRNRVDVCKRSNGDAQNSMDVDEVPPVYRVLIQMREKKYKEFNSAMAWCLENIETR